MQSGFASGFVQPPMQQSRAAPASIQSAGFSDSGYQFDFIGGSDSTPAIGAASPAPAVNSRTTAVAGTGAVRPAVIGAAPTDPFSSMFSGLQVAPAAATSSSANRSSQPMLAKDAFNDPFASLSAGGMSDPFSNAQPSPVYPAGQLGRPHQQASALPPSVSTSSWAAADEDGSAFDFMS